MRLIITNERTNQPTKELTEDRDLCDMSSLRPSVCLAIPALNASWGSVTDTITGIALTLAISRRS
jgi:hypothetical protein